MSTASSRASRALRFQAALIHRPIQDLETLRAKIQTAIELEFSTIPLYLTALYSIKDRSSSAYQVVRSVVIEEMFHVNTACNLLVAVNGQPKLTGDAVPTYPSYLPSADTDPNDPDPTPYVILAAATPGQFKNVFMRIEKPAPYFAPAQGQNYQTIGQFYKAIEQGLETCVGKYGSAAVFPADTIGEQRTDIYIGKFGGRTVRIDDLESAKFAIGQIVEQGEGAVMPSKPLVPIEPYGAYNHYGNRIDGTYGPIAGTPYELSHYFKFKAIAEDPANFPTAYPIISSSLVDNYEHNESAQELSSVFDKLYSVMLKAFEQAFKSGTQGRDIFFKVALPIMHEGLVEVTAKLMNTPIYANGDAGVGPNAAPLWHYNPAASLAEVHQLLHHIAPGYTFGLRQRQSFNSSFNRLDRLIGALRESSANLAVSF